MERFLCKGWSCGVAVFRIYIVCFHNTSSVVFYGKVGVAVFYDTLSVVVCNIMRSCDQSRDRSNQIGTISDHY